MAEQHTSSPSAQTSLAQAPLTSVYTNNLPAILDHFGISLAISTYQAGKVILVRSDGGGINTHFRDFNKPMGLAVDGQVAPGQTWYYWLEDVDLSGATSLHGPVSATLQAPTAVTVAALEAQAASPGTVTTWGALVAGLLAAAGALAARRRAP